MKCRKVRVVTDMYNGYEAQMWRIWFPFWVMIGINTFPTLERAIWFAERALKKEVWRDGK